MVQALKPNVLFVMDKWCHGNPKFGISAWESNLYNSLSTTELANVDTFHFDDYWCAHQSPGDDVLLTKCKETSPDLIIIIIYNDHATPKRETIETLAGWDIPIVAIWGDLQLPEQVELSKTITPFVCFHVYTASTRPGLYNWQPDKYLYSWVPKDSRYFFDPGTPRDIDFSYIGAPRRDRMEFVNMLRKCGVEIFQAGGERYQHLTNQEYAQFLQRSKTTLSFAYQKPSRNVVNARVFEAMACGALLMETESPEITHFFTPFIDYVPYDSVEDLIVKVQHYQAHEEEQRAIAENGNRSYIENYSALRFWQIVLDKVFDPAKKDIRFLEGI
jgi:glycosyltransferase involved in cell wall biosynthesis